MSLDVNVSDLLWAFEIYGPSEVSYDARVLATRGSRV